MSSVAGWENEPWFVKQGNVLLKQLRMQHMFSVSGTRQSELEEQLRIECDDPLEKANAIIVKRKLQLKKSSGKNYSYNKKAVRGNGKAGFGK